MDNSSTKQKQEIHAKFFVQKSSFFGLTKRLLIVHQNGIVIETIGKQDQQEAILFSDLSVIEAPARNNNEILFGTKKNASLSVLCTDRTKCIGEIYQVWDKYILSKSPRLEKAFPTFEISKQVLPNHNDLLLESQITIYRTHLEINHKSLQSTKNQGNNNDTFIEIESSESGISNSTSISFSSIKNIQKTHSGIIFTMKGSLMKHRFLFFDMEKVNGLISKIQSNCQEYIDSSKNIPVEYIDDEVLQFSHPFKSLSPILFECKVYKLLETGHLYQLKVMISDEYIMEVDLKTNCVIQKYDIKGVDDFVQLAAGIPAICIIFTDESRIVYIPEEHEKDLISSNFFTLINWKRPNQDFPIGRNDFIHCTLPNRNCRVQCWPNEEVDPDYENDLMKGFINSKDEDEVMRYLTEFTLNAVLKNPKNTDLKPLQFLMKPFIKYAKVIKTKQFLKYWDSLQADLTVIYKPNMRRKSIIMEKQERFKSFGNYDPNENFTIQLNIQPFITILTKAEEILKALNILISSKAFFKEISTNKKDVSLFEEFLKELISLVETPYPTLNHLAGSFFRLFCRFNTPTEKKTETLNKRFFLTNKLGLLQTISQTLARQVLVKKDDLSPEAHLDGLQVHSILACLRILKTFLSDRKETTDESDLQIVQRLISCAYYFCICNFLMRTKSIALVYNATILLSTSFQNCTHQQLYKKVQSRFLDNSSLVPLNIIYVFSSPVIPQRKLSMTLLAHVFFANEDACTWLLQVFPKYLFTKVDSQATYITDWSLQQWEQFFSILVQNFNTPTEQWNEDCRIELLKKLKETDNEVSSALERCPPGKIWELVDPSFKNDGEFLLNIRWNHEEFHIQYENLLNKVLVWKYFLTSLVKDSETPSLNAKISNPAKFWSELHIKFITESQLYEQKKILKAMILLYQTYTAEIKEMSTIPFWLKQINKPEFVHLRYLVLQLLYTCLTVENAKVSHKNLIKFIDCNGLHILGNVLAGLYFEENHDSITQAEYEKLRDSVLPDVDYNYTKLELPRQAFTPSLRQAASIYLILQILKTAFAKSAIKTSSINEDQLICPLPKAKQQLTKPKTLQALVNILLLNDDSLILELLHLFAAYFTDKQGFDILIKETPFFDFLLVNINLRTAPSRFNLILQIYHRVADRLPTEENPIKIYTDFSFLPVSSEISSAAFSLFPPLKYLPKHLIWKLINSGVNELIRIFFAPYYESPEVIWTDRMKEKVIETLKTQTQEYRNNMIAYSESRDIHSAAELEHYQSNPEPIQFNSVTEEVTCGPIILRVWTKKMFRAFELSRKEILLFVQNLNTSLKTAVTESSSLKEVTPKYLSETLVTVESHAKAIKLYSLKNYECFEQVVILMNHFADQMKNENFNKTPLDPTTASYLIALHKIIFRTIRLEQSDNIQVFLNSGGYQVLIAIFNSLVAKIKHQNSNKETQAPLNFDISYPEFRIVNLAVKIFKEILTKSPESFLMHFDVKFQLFLDFQIVSKVSLGLFEFIKVQYDEAETGEKDSAENSFESAKEMNYDVQTTSIFKVITSEYDPDLIAAYVEKLLNYTHCLFEFLVKFSTKIEFISLFVQSGLVWRCIELITYFEDPNKYSKKIEDKSYRRTVTYIEVICNLLRNVCIFSNEANKLKLSSGTNKQVDSGLKTKSEKSPEFLASLEKLEGFERTVLSKFQTAVIHLVGKAILQVLLVDAVEPVVTPNEQDRDNILRFMRIIATSYSDPVTLWSQETKQELKELILSQMGLINDSHGKAFFNAIESFEYKCYQRELVIDNLFISSLNKNPEFKVPNSKTFILKIVKEINGVWRNIKEYKPTGESFEGLEAQFIRLHDAIVCISNIIVSEGCEDSLLFETNMTCFGNILHDQCLKEIQSSNTIVIKRKILQILIHLSKNINGAVKVVENVAIMKNITAIMRDNTKETETLSSEVIDLLENLSKFENLAVLSINYGFYLILIEFCLKNELFANRAREKGLKLILDITKSHPETFDKVLNLIFPEAIQALLKSDQMTPQRFLTGLDYGCDEPTAFWTQLMRHEALHALYKIGSRIQAKWDLQQSKEIKIIENYSFWTEEFNELKPVYPELKNNILIEGIYLENLNKNTNFDQTNILPFYSQLSKRGSSLFTELKQAISTVKNSRVDESQDLLHHQLATVQSAFLFASDWLLNKSKSYDRRKSKLSVYGSFSKNMMTPPTSEPQQDSGNSLMTQELEEIFVSFVLEGLDLVTSPSVGHHVLTLQLELVYLLAENENGFAALKSKGLIDILAKLLKQIVQTDNSKSSWNHVEEKLILHLLLKALYKDPSLVKSVIDLCADSLKALLGGPKVYLKEILENIITLIAKDLEHGRKTFVKLNEEKNLISVSTVHDCNPEALIASFWKSICTGWSCYETQNTLNIILNQQQDKSIHLPILSEYAVDPLPDISGDVKKIEQVVEPYLAKIVKEYSSSYAESVW